MPSRNALLDYAVLDRTLPPIDWTGRDIRPSGIDILASSAPPPLPVAAPARRATPADELSDEMLDAYFQALASGARPPPAPADLGPAPPPAAVQAVEDASRGIDFADPRTGPVGRVPADTPSVLGVRTPPVARSAYEPVGEALAAFGTGRDDMLGAAARTAAPYVSGGARAARAVVNTAAELTGVPAAARAGRALAYDDTTRAVGNALMALPSRFAAIPGMFFNEAAAETEDPRRQTIRDLQKEIREGEQRAREVAARRYTGRTEADRLAARQAAVDAETRALQPTRDRLKRIQDQLDAEVDAAAAQRLAEERGAAYRSTPTNQAYPGVIYGTTGLGAAAGTILPMISARRPVVAFNARTADIETRWRAALDRAGDMNLPLATRRQAAQEAIGLRAQHQAALAAAPGDLTWGDRLRSGLTGGAMLDLGLVAPDFADYVYSFNDPTGPLHSSSGNAINPFTNPTRFGTGFSVGAALGGLGEEIGSRFPGQRTTLSYDAETNALMRRYPSLAGGRRRSGSKSPRRCRRPVRRRGARRQRGCPRGRPPLSKRAMVQERRRSRRGK